MSSIHPTAVIEAGAEIAADVEIGPFAVIGAQVRIGPGTRVGAHTVISGRTTIGARNRIFPFCALGGIPQDKKYRDEDTELIVGDDNTIREYVTMNIGTTQDGGVTRVGSDNWIMAYVHFAHDCQVGDHTILANGVQLAGHVHVGDWAIIGGITGVHQFVHVGAHAMAGAGTTLLQDLPPFVICNGNPAEPHGINVEGLRRRGFSAASISALRRGYKLLYKDGNTVAQAAQALDALAAEVGEAAPHLRALRDFVLASQRGITR
jgi:UDP-N-acetylglucosamine acyltransferase